MDQGEYGQYTSNAWVSDPSFLHLQRVSVAKEFLRKVGRWREFPIAFSASSAWSSAQNMSTEDADAYLVF